MSGNSHLLCLGIETSCDETSLALVDDGRLIAHVLASQSELHALFGGVVPELASREHYRYLGSLFDELMRRSGRAVTDINVIAVARGPGLLGSLLVGVAFAKALALALGVRLIGVNHLHAHLLATGLEHDLVYPSLGLLVSGGHTSIYRIDSPAAFVELGRTIDDACGEAFDKVGTLLGMMYPAGRLVDLAAQRGEAKVELPLPYLQNDTLDFSFSGLKTAAATWIREHLSALSWKKPVTEVESLPPEVRDLCASFTHAVAETLARKLERAFERTQNVKALLLAGGVAASCAVRARMREVAERHSVPLLVPSPGLCTDNGAMVAYAGSLLASLGLRHALDMEAIPRGRRIPADFIASDSHLIAGLVS